MPSSSATVTLVVRRDSRMLQTRALAAGLNVDARTVSTSERPFEVKVFGRHDADVSVDSLCAGLSAEISDLVEDGND